MKWFNADLHIHSVLSPCGDLDMSPARIIKEATNKNLDIVGITDHNTSLHAECMIELGRKNGITVFPGFELNTQEEIHCLAFFENLDITKRFQQKVESLYIGIKNKSERFGEQLIVNASEEILGEVDDLLFAGLKMGINELEKEVHKLNGIFIPAHIDRGNNSIYSQLGFIPTDLNADALEISYRADRNEVLKKRPEISDFTLITNSDAHLPEQILRAYTKYYMEAPTFNEWKLALKGLGGRAIEMS